MVVQLFLVFLTLFETVTLDLTKTCPPPEEIPQCTCHLNINFRIFCKELYNPQSLKATSTVLSKYDVYQLRLDDCFLMYLPKKMFPRLHIKEIEMYNTEVLGLESDDGVEMFQGIENSLRRIYFYNVTGINSWRWSAFSILRSLESFIIRRGDLVALKEDFLSICPESLKTVHLAYNKISHIHPGAFSNHTQLESWELPGNEIVEISRDVLPKPANHLRMIALYENKIKAIPDDFFTEMPKLKYVYLWGNNVKFLNQEMFMPLKNGQKFLLDIRYNEIYCCESLKFLVNEPYQELINGDCLYPAEVKNKNILSLTEVDLDHGLC